jgi:hypothetical protein
MKCPLCESLSKKVIYMGFPMKMCPDSSCNCMWGFWSWIPRIWFNGVCMEYDGDYLAALVYWMSGK